MSRRWTIALMMVLQLVTSIEAAAEGGSASNLAENSASSTLIEAQPVDVGVNCTYEKIGPPNGQGIAPECKTDEAGITFATTAALNGQTCWNALLLSQRRPEAFRVAVKNYYETVLGSSEFAVCTKPPEPAHCTRGFCWVDYSYGLSIQPLVDVGITVALGKPDFGFKTNTSTVLQTQVGLKVTGFAWSGRADAHVLVGIANATQTTESGDKDALGIVYGLGVGFWNGIIGVNGLAIMDPTDGSRWGFGVSFTVDPVAAVSATK